MISFKSLYNNYNKYSEKKLVLPLIKHQQIKHIVENLRKEKKVNVDLIGYSIEGREIYSISIGKGDTVVLAWSQMHGDEPTATAAIFDTINFFLANDELIDFKKNILSKLKIYYVPMLNPDGAERVKRENSLNIDLNRDALRSESYESQILWELAKKIKPSFAFNLHDQNKYYTAGISNNTAAISLLATPCDFDKNITETRKKSMHLIVKILEVLKEFIPQNIARYDDDFEPRAFGDNFTKSGISSILIESGFLNNDPLKMEIRKLNFVALLSSFYFISNEGYKETNYMDYFIIPENKQLLFDLLLRNLLLIKNEKSFKVDIGIIREKKYDVDQNKFYYVGKIKEIGDLSIYHGFEEYDLDGFEVKLADIFNNTQNVDLKNIDFIQLIKRGYGYIYDNFIQFDKDYTDLPINILCYKNYRPEIAVDEYANLLLTKGKDKVYIVINGFFQVLNYSENRILNGIIIH